MMRVYVSARRPVRSNAVTFRPVYKVGDCTDVLFVFSSINADNQVDTRIFDDVDAAIVAMNESDNQENSIICIYERGEGCEYVYVSEVDLTEGGTSNNDASVDGVASVGGAASVDDVSDEGVSVASSG